ncbi:hypothetical protein DS745_03505 [Anaerobacillus alkaliphilus]|uniref:Lipoprotein n=1 Tax=Anaerobacillus alkaliphilus TaxID=1548597 RepID=A0A4Q0VXI5_9BACI|nr:hypothetical protein [Anaerobacillus alkaliphilus]RXJ04463.1 hypothetical protein DS745_03505 [Anaerobacillus alkaliphilus]
MKSKSLLSVVLLILLGNGLVGCFNSNVDQGLIVPSELLTTEKSFPNDFFEIAEQGFIVSKVTTQSDFNKQWEFFGLSDNPAQIDWKNHVVIFLGTGESGTCPMEFQFVDLNEEKTKMTIHLKEKSKGACTDDFTPRTIVLSVNAKEISNVSLVEINRSGGSNLINPVLEFLESK